ncbi:hypothetical protein CCL22_01965 [Pseudomonas syringae]|nr:hypothetical protein CCL22_01965 [Pseudomonas syringae]
MAKCASHGEKDCEVMLTYFNQCAAISTPEIDGKQSGGGTSQEVLHLRRHQPARPQGADRIISHLLSAE